MNAKIALRPKLDLIFSPDISTIEKFQNETLRPILKLQNDLFVAYFREYLKNKNFETLSADKKAQHINGSLQNDLALKNMCIGIIVGMFTEKELAIYICDRKTFSKRIITMLSERLRDQLI